VYCCAVGTHLQAVPAVPAPIGADGQEPSGNVVDAAQPPQQQQQQQQQHTTQSEEEEEVGALLDACFAGDDEPARAPINDVVCCLV
jgi:hypothetical protein